MSAALDFEWGGIVLTLLFLTFLYFLPAIIGRDKRDAAGIIADCIEASGHEERTDQGLMTEKLRVELRRFFKKRSGRRPLVLPILMEI